MYFSVWLSNRRLILAACLIVSSGCTGNSDYGSFVPYADTAPGTSAESDVAAVDTAAPARGAESQTTAEVTADRAIPPGASGSPESDSPELVTQTSSADSESQTNPDEDDAVTDHGNLAVSVADPAPEATKPADLPPQVSENSGVEAAEVETGESDAAAVKSTGVAAKGSETPESATGVPREIQLLIPDQSFRRERNSTAVRVSYDDIDLLKILNMEPVPVDAVKHFPDWLKALDGTAVRIRGFMYPTFEATGLTGFTLARDNGICCFVRQPKIYDIIAIELASGVTSDYIEGKPFDVEGVFRIQPEADETELYRLYRIENARVLR